MSNQATLLQYYVALNWAREMVSDIDNGAAKFQFINGNGDASDVTLDIREQQLRMIEILDDLVALNTDQKNRECSKPDKMRGRSV